MYIYATIMSCFLVFLLIISISYFRKKKINSTEIRLYSLSLAASLGSLVLELLSCYFVYNYNSFYYVALIINRCFIISIGIWMYILTRYVYSISENFDNKISEYIYKNAKTIHKIYDILFSIFAILAIVLPLKFYKEGTIVYSYGPAAQIASIEVGFYVVSCLTCFILNRKNVNVKEYLPMFVFVIIVTIMLFVRNIRPDVLFVSSCEALVCIIMYFTIENPDVKMIEQLEIAKEQADRANHAKSDFLSNMSHEIRTPLNAIVGFSETLKDEDIPESARENVDDIIMASNNLLDIVNGILDISKIEANKLEIINKEYDIKSILDELIALTKARIGDKGLDFRVNIDPTIPRVLYGDNIRLKQVVLNILTNAVKYTKEGYVIFTVSSVIKDNVCRLIFSVEDSGIGIKEESIPKLFSKFERLDVEKEITIEGTGLGLAITKRLIELMNGTIVVQSVYGKGSKFTISLDQRIIAVEAPVIHEAPAAETKVVDAKGAKILVVDDNDLNLKVASALLNKYHFTIDTATNGVECVNKVKRGGEYDIIFLDDMMPKMNGREALAKLKEDPNFDIPVIALTANAITGMRQEYLNCGFNDYLSKPIEKQELERVIKEYISKKRSSYANTDLSKSTNSILEKQFTIDLPVLAQNTSEIPTNSDNSNKKVLVVDDNEMNLKIAVSNLKKYGFTIDSVSSGSDAIAKVIENHYDIIFLDEMMPELDGCKTLENLRDIDGFDTPTIMMTASPEDEVRDKIEEYKFNGYLAKPFKKEELDRVINDLLK